MKKLFYVIIKNININFNMMYYNVQIMKIMKIVYNNI